MSDFFLAVWQLTHFTEKGSKHHLVSHSIHCNEQHFRKVPPNHIANPKSWSGKFCVSTTPAIVLFLVSYVDEETKLHRLTIVYAFPVPNQKTCSFVGDMLPPIAVSSTTCNNVCLGLYVEYGANWHVIVSMWKAVSFHRTTPTGVIFPTDLIGRATLALEPSNYFIEYILCTGRRSKSI